MAKGRTYSKKAPAPRNAIEALPHLRSFMIDLYDRKDGMAADWALIAETLFREAFATLDLARDDPRVAAILHKAQSGAYDRLTAAPGSAMGQAPAPLPSADLAVPRPVPNVTLKS